MAGALVAICVIAGFQLGARSGEGKRGTLAGTGNSPSPHSTQTSAPPAPSPAPTNAVAILPQSGVHVRVRLVGGRSWLHVTGSNGQVLFEGILNKGAQRDFADTRRIRMTIGNAGAVDLIVNGHDLGLAGGSGQVVPKSFGPSSASGNGG